MTRPAWYPNWEGETVTIVASGPSAADVDLDSGIGRTRFVAINNSWRLCPWADALYGCDVQWWDHYNGCQEFKGSLKICADHRIRDRPKSWGVSFLHCDRSGDTFELNEIGKVGWGGNSGYSALNLVAQLRPAKVLLVGYDASKAWGAHWHEPHSGNLSNPSNINIERWRRVIEWASIPLKGAGITVINCSPISTLKKYPKMSFEEALDYEPGTPLPAPPDPVPWPEFVNCPLPDAEMRLLDPIGNAKTMLELGNKRNAKGSYKAYFTKLGIVHTSVDLNGKDGALPLDLQQPLELGRRFDIVTNFGTSEHVDRQEPCWRNIIKHTEKLLISTTPLPGDWSWHGKWYPRPEFYKALAENNGFKLERLYVSGVSPRQMVFARMARTELHPFSMPPLSLIYENIQGKKVGKYG